MNKNQLIKEFKKINYLKGKLILELRRRGILDFCVCCNKSIIRLINNKYCSSCSVYTNKLRSKIGGLKTMLKTLRIKVYGQEKGSERLRWK